MLHRILLSQDELEHINMALLSYSSELADTKKTMPQTKENIEYIDRQREINCHLATYINCKL